jgi:hypothetical protein
MKNITAHFLRSVCKLPLCSVSYGVGLKYFVDRRNELNVHIRLKGHQQQGVIVVDASFVILASEKVALGVNSRFFLNSCTPGI